MTYQDRQIIKKINPRSTGEVSENLYTKFSKEVDLKYEAKELLRCADAGLYTKNIRTVKFVSYDEEKNLLSTKRIYGNELFLLLWNATSLLGILRGKNKLINFDVASSRAKELGDWLSKYHRSTSFTECNAEVSDWLKKSFITKLQGIRENNLLPEKKLRKIELHFLKEFDNLIHDEYLEKNNVKICRIHGDFIIYNMLFDKEDNIHVMDFGDTRKGTNIEDVARLYSNLWAISQTSRLRKAKFLKMADNFLQAYGLKKDIVDTPFFKAVMAYNFLIHLYGQFCMRDSLSFNSNYELSQITKAGIAWIDKQLS